MLFETLAKLFRTQPKKRPARRRSQHISAAQLEILENREMLSAVVATGYGTNQFVEDIASNFGGKVVDINGDGALDVIGDTVHIRNGGGWLTYANGPGVGTLVDIDGDNDLDVVRGRHWVENLGGGTSWLQHEVATVASGVVHVSSDVADFDRDGDMDIVISRESKIHWFENVNGDGSTWTEHTVISGSPFDFVATAAGDMDNDGDMDVVVSADDYVILWLENLGRGAFADHFYNQIGSTADDGRVYTSASTLNVGDFDQDGRTDVIAVDTGDNTTAIRWFTPKEDPTSTFRRTTIDRLEWADSETTSVDIDNDGQLELLVTSRFNYRTGDDRVWIYERTSDFGFTRVQVGSDYIGPVIGTGDLDNDGDLDLVGKNFIFWNTGGDFHIETTDVSPISIASGRTSPVLRIDATHNGQFGDEDILLANFSFMVDDGSGQVGANPLDSSTFASLFDSWRIYLDDGDGIFMGDEDLLVSVTPATQSGVVQVDLATAAATLRRLHPEETRSFFLEVDMGATAHEYGDFRITNLTDLGILAGKDAGAVDPSGITNVIKDYSPNVSASLVSASNIAFTLNTVTLNEGIIPPSTTIEVLRIDATQAGLVEGEIASLAFRFDEDGRPLDHTEVNGLIESLIIEGEDRNTIVRVDDLNVNNSGLLRIELPDGDSRVRFLNESKSFFVVVQTGADSINQGGRKFRITHLTDASNVEDERSFVEVASNDGPATLVGTPDQSATIFAGTEINIAVTSSLSTPVTGQQVTYTVTVANQHDTTDASAIPLAGRIPANLLNVVLTNLQVTGGATSTKSIGESVSGNWTDTLDLPHQGSVTYTFTGTIAELGATDRSMESEFLISQVSVDLPVEFYDLNSADNQSLRSDLIRLSSTGTGEFVDSGIDFADLDGLGAERVNKIALGDIDGDGDVDAIVTRGAAGAPGYATVLLNDGAGNYTESNQDLGYSNFTGAVLADFDRDGDLDLYLATSTGISGVTDDTDRVYLNDGSGVFTKTVQSFSYLTEAVQVGDTDRDGDLDIVISGADFSYTLRNFGGGIFVPSSRLGVLDNLSQMKFADMDSDGDLDIVGLGTDLRLFLNDGRGFYQAGIRVTRFATDFELGDLDNDGNIDILVAEGSYYDPNSDFLGDERLLSSLVSFSNDGTGNFAQSIVSLPSSYQQIELGDFDNDGDLDAFVVDEIYDGTYDIQLYRGIYYGTVYGVDLAVPETVVGKFLSNDGTGMFADSGQTLDYQVELSDELTYSPNELSLTAADINGDGSLDVVTGDFTAAKVWFNSAPANTPATISLDNELNSILELTILNVDQKVADIVITDDGNGTNNLSLAGADASYFVLSGTELFLKAGTVLDFESKATYTVDVRVDDSSIGSTPDDTVTFVLNVIDVPEPPEVDVKLDLTDVPSGNGVLFNNAALGGTAPSLTFTVENNGIGDLILQPISVPAGFTLTSANFAANQVVAPGSSVNFTVQMNTNSSGVKSGALTFATNDSTASEQTYAINLSGAVIAPTTSPTTVAGGALLIDDGDAGYFAPGNWTTFGAGYNGDGQYAKSHDGPDRAIWAFGGLGAGQFRVFITWQNGGDKADDVTVLVRDGVGGTVLSTNSIAENVAPLNDRYEGGRRFQLLDTVAITGTDLVVELVDNGTGKTIVADAVLIESFTPPPATPEITVREAGDLMDGGTFVFDSVVEGGTRSATFTIRNDGSADIILQPASISGSAFSIRTGTNFTADQHLIPGASVTITVDVATSAAGSFNGMLSIPSNDGDENPFDLTLQATVNPVGAASFIMDDGDSGFSLTGNWSNVTTVGYGGDAKAIGVAKSGTATWTFTGLSAGEYVVSTTWLNGSDRADAVNYVIQDGSGGSVLSMVPINQKNAPTGDTYGGRKFQGLGSVTITGDTLVVVVDNAGTNGAVIADAVRIEAVTPPPNTPEIDVKQGVLSVLDNGSFNVGSANQGDSQLEKVFSVKNTGTANLTLEPITVTGTGFSLVGANFTSGQVLAPNETATFTIGLSTATLGSFTGNVSFLNNDGDENPFNFDLSGSINVAPPAGVSIIDDGDTGFSTSGVVAPVSTTAGYGGDFLVANSKNGVDTAQWEFTGLTAGTYDVAITWQRAGDRSTDVQYTILDGLGGSVLHTAHVDQTVNPVAGVTDGGRTFQLLSNVSITGTSLVIQLTNAAATGGVIIDAARIQKTS